MQTSKGVKLQQLDADYNQVFSEKRTAVHNIVAAIHADDDMQIHAQANAIKDLQQKELGLRDSVKATIASAIPGARTQDRDYIFLNFVLKHLPHGIIGLLLAVMFSAAMSSMASELNALASTTTVDIYKRAILKGKASLKDLQASRYFTIMWAMLAMGFSMLATFAENLIQFVNIIGSLFYGTILGIFLTAFYLKRVKGTAVFWSAILAEAVVLYCFKYTEIAFLLYNIIGCAIVMIVSLVAQLIVDSGKTELKS